MPPQLPCARLSNKNIFIQFHSCRLLLVSSAPSHSLLGLYKWSVARTGEHAGTFAFPERGKDLQFEKLLRIQCIKFVLLAANGNMKKCMEEIWRSWTKKNLKTSSCFAVVMFIFLLLCSLENCFMIFSWFLFVLMIFTIFSLNFLPPSFCNARFNLCGRQWCSWLLFWNYDTLNFYSNLTQWSRHFNFDCNYFSISGYFFV